MPGTLRAAAGGQCRGRPAAAGRRSRADRRDVQLVGGDPRLPAPGAGRGGHRPARPDEPRDVRRAHPRAGDRSCARRWSRSRRPAWSTCSCATPGRSASRSRSRWRCSSGARAAAAAKQRLLTWRGGYHGDTFHPMSVCDPDGGMHSLWTGVLPEQVFLPMPPAGFDAPPDPVLPGPDRRRRWSGTADELAAVIVEPVVQGAGGMRFHHPGYLRGASRRLRPARRAADLRRDRHRLRAYRQVVRRRPRRRAPRHHVRRQGADRRLPEHGGDAVHGGGGRRDRRRASCRCWRTARRSWATRWPARWPTLSVRAGPPPGDGR